MNYRDPFAAAQLNTATYDAGLRSYMLKVYNYMASALILTGIVALFTAHSPTMLGLLYNVRGDSVGISGFGLLVIFAPLALVFLLGAGINTMSAQAVQAIFWAYATLLGLSMSSILIAYTGESVAKVFFITAGTFGAMSIYGNTTKRDLTNFGSFLLMGLIGLIVASIVNMFLHSNGLQFAISFIGVLVFVGLTAYDTQKLRSMYYQSAGNSEAVSKATTLGALTLYLDFINMFVYLMRFFGNRR